MNSFSIQIQRGEDSSFEFVTAVPPLVVLLAIIAFAALVRPAQLPVWIAARECARTGIATLNQDIGIAQAEQAARQSLIGNALNAASADVQIEVGQWDRGSAVTCRVAYRIDVSGLPFLGSLVPNGVIPIESAVTMRVEPFKARWQ